MESVLYARKDSLVTYEAGCHAHGELIRILRKKLLVWIRGLGGSNGEQDVIAKTLLAV